MAFHSATFTNMTQDQLDGIRMFINMNEWTNIVIEECATTVSQEAENDTGSTDAAPTASGSNINTPPIFCDILQNNAYEACQHCFLQPCATHYPQSWLVKKRVPHNGNCKTRLRMYKKFWSVMSHRDAWKHPFYVTKKQVHLSASFPDIVWERGAGPHSEREIMPHCVLELVRDLCPNPPGQDYTGHKW